MDIVDREVSLAEISKTVGPPPASKLTRSVRMNGAVLPVILEERIEDGGQIQFHIVNGNRRIAAMRRAKMRSVPARIIRNAAREELAKLTLLTNSYRSSNYVTEFWAIRQLDARESITSRFPKKQA